jgi:hypothetical protein
MSKTRAEFITQCLYNLGVIAQGQSVSDQEVSKIDAIVDPAFAKLAALDIYYVQDPGSIGPADGEIEDSAFLSLADYVANAACAAFNLPADTKMQALSMLAESSLRTITAPSRTLQTLRVDPALRVRAYGRYRGGF